MSIIVNKEPKDKIILDLCGGTGAWSRPYAEAGYVVRLYDIVQNPLMDVRLMEHGIGCNDDATYWHGIEGNHPVYGILAAPPCTHLAGSGARWWDGKGQEALLNALSVVDACMRIILLHKPKFWCLENPVGRLTRFLGKPVMYFNPCDYGDPWTKKTCLWGNFNSPLKKPVEPTEGSKIHLMAPSEDRAALRSISPPGFAKAFFEANP